VIRGNILTYDIAQQRGLIFGWDARHYVFHLADMMDGAAPPIGARVEFQPIGRPRRCRAGSCAASPNRSPSRPASRAARASRRRSTGG